MKTMENRLIEALMLTDEDRVILLQDLSDLLDFDATAKLLLSTIEQVKAEQGDEVWKVNKMTFLLYLWRNAYMLGYQQALLDLIEAQKEGLAKYTAANVKKQLDDHRQIEAENARKQQEWKQ